MFLGGERKLKKTEETQIKKGHDVKQDLTWDPGAVRVSTLTR